MFIVFEGIDGTGKTTAAQRLTRHLPCALPSEVYNNMRSIRAYVDGLDNPYARMHYWLSLNHANSARAARILSEGKLNVVLDSYFYRTIVTHAVLGIDVEAYLDWSKIVKPDYVFVLTTERSVLTSRLMARGSGDLYRNECERKIFESSEQIDEHYREMSRRNGFFQIDSTESTPDQIVQSVLNEIAC